MDQCLKLTEAHARAAVLGGALLGGGGGGSAADGLEAARLALRLGDLVLTPLSALRDEQTVLTASAVGAPAAKNRYIRPAYYIRTVELYQQHFGIKPDGIISNECGGNATVNGWLQAAALNLPLLDAPCNGRAHPTGIMGSLGLHRDPHYQSRQIAVGGDPAQGRYIELAASGSLDSASGMIRSASVHAGGLVAVARNPVSAAYAKQHAAVGAVSQCIALGTAMLAAQEKAAAAAIDAAADYLQGKVICRGSVGSVELETRGGFDVGRVTLDTAGGSVELTFWNEYMTLEIDGQRLGTFPDLIATLDAVSGCPLATAEITAGREIAVLWAHRDRLLLGAGMRDATLFNVAEQAVGRSLIPYVFPN
ncbi:MAG: DUF917 family protein [Sporomusaceae bacterium]|nr:DUF917 family protein [Sporomusaceae bacterium]